MTSTLTYREEKQKEWEKLIKKHRLTFVTHGDDLFHDFLDRLHFNHALKGKEDCRVFFKMVKITFNSKWMMTFRIKYGCSNV